MSELPPADDTTSKPLWYTPLWHLITDIPACIRPGKERFFLVINFAVLSSGLGHALFIPLFGFLQITPLTLYNVGSVALFCVAWRLNRKGYSNLAMLLSVAEFIGHVWLATLLVGWSFGFHFYMISWCFLPFFGPTGDRWLKVTIFTSIAGTFIALNQFAAVSPLPENAWQLAYSGPINAFNFVFFCCGFGFACFHFRNLVDKAEAVAKAAFARSEWLLHNILPVTIAERLKEDSSVIAEAHLSASVLFLDIADFTPLAETMSPEELVHMLNTIFSRLDDLAEQHEIEKIKTIGDSYMVAAGVPISQEDHAERIGRFALDSLDVMHGFSDHHGEPLKVRIGIDTGSVIAGVIGARKFIYDMWGDMVNTASRMESHGIPDRIHTTEAFQIAAHDSFVFEKRGKVSIKGKGEMETYFLTSVAG